MENETFKNVAYRKLKDKITRGDFDKDGYTSENKLVAEFGMSRTPIREALLQLQSEGFIKIAPKQGIFIQKPSIQETNEYYDLRVAIETYVIKNLKGLIKEEDFIRLDQILQCQKEACESENYAASMEYDETFHDTLLQLFGNNLFLQLLRNMRQRLSMNPDLYRRKERFGDGLNEHIEIVEDLKQGNYELAEQKLYAHIWGSKLYYLDCVVLIQK